MYFLTNVNVRKGIFMIIDNKNVSDVINITINVLNNVQK